jgi:hypothetical protein
MDQCKRNKRFNSEGKSFKLGSEFSKDFILDIVIHRILFTPETGFAGTTFFPYSAETLEFRYK